jgi:hypothetical protein
MKADKLKQTGTNRAPQQALPGNGACRLKDFNFLWLSGPQISPSLVMGSRQQMKEKSASGSIIHRAIDSVRTFMDCGGAVITEATAGNPKLKGLVYVAVFAPDPDLERFMAKRTSAFTSKINASHAWIRLQDGPDSQTIETAAARIK